MLKNIILPSLLILTFLAVIFFSISDPFDASAGKVIRFSTTSIKYFDYQNAIKSAHQNKYVGRLICYNGRYKGVDVSFEDVMLRTDIKLFLKELFNSDSWTGCNLEITDPTSSPPHKVIVAQEKDKHSYAYTITVHEPPQTSQILMRLKIMYMAYRLGLPLTLFTPCVGTGIFSTCIVTASPDIPTTNF